MHYRTDCKQDHPQTPSLLDRFVEALKTVYPHTVYPDADESYFIGFSIPVEKLKEHISLGCLKCELCNMEDRRETCAVFAWTNFELFLMDKEEDWGTKIHIFSIYPYSDCEEIPNIFQSGRVVLLENNHPIDKR